MAGDEFSIADISAYVFISFIKNLDIEVTDSLSHLKAWFITMAQRPAIVSLTPKNSGANAWWWIFIGTKVSSYKRYNLKESSW